MIAKELYDRDFLEWTRCNAALLRARRFEEADIEHLAEEIEDMGKSQQRELESRLLATFRRKNAGVSPLVGAAD